MIILVQARELSPDELAWPLKLLLILLGYSTVAAPALLLILYVKRRYTGEFVRSLMARRVFFDAELINLNDLIRLDKLR